MGHLSVLVQGLGLVVTGTLPVFNLTEDSSDRKVGEWLHHSGCNGAIGVGSVGGVKRVPSCWVHARR